MSRIEIAALAGVFLALSVAGVDAQTIRPQYMRPLSEVQDLCQQGNFAAADQKLAAVEAMGGFTPYELQKVREFRLFIDIKLDRKDKIVEENRVLHGSASSGSNAGMATASAATGPIESNISDAFYKNLAAGVAKYSTWQSATITFGSMKYEDGQYGVVWREYPSTVIAEQNARSARMKSNFSWDDWKQSSDNGPYANTWKLACVFPASAGAELAKIPAGTKRMVQVKIKAAEDHGAVFDCKL